MEEEAFRCKNEIDHSGGAQEYLNFERWYAKDHPVDVGLFWL